MGAEKFPAVDEIPWDKITSMRVSKDGQNFSFEFDLEGRKQKMTLSLTSTGSSLTLSKSDGTPIINSTQKGDTFSIMDFSAKPAIPKWLKTIQKKNS
jgi:hypothetical protein